MTAVTVQVIQCGLTQLSITVSLNANVSNPFQSLLHYDIHLNFKMINDLKTNTKKTSFIFLEIDMIIHF